MRPGAAVPLRGDGEDDDDDGGCIAVLAVVDEEMSYREAPRSQEILVTTTHVSSSCLQWSRVTSYADGDYCPVVHVRS